LIEFEFISLTSLENSNRCVNGKPLTVMRCELESSDLSQKIKLEFSFSLLNRAKSKPRCAKKVMLKSLQRYAVTYKVENGIICCLRQFSQKMQDKGNYQNNQKYFNGERSQNREFRKWVPVSPEPSKSGLAFSVLNYNILSQQLLEMHSYLYHSKQDLRWNQRFYNIVGEIFHNNPDIMCCQVRVASSAKRR
jgi:hypothetical protein